MPAQLGLKAGDKAALADEASLVLVDARADDASEACMVGQEDGRGGDGPCKQVGCPRAGREAEAHWHIVLVADGVDAAAKEGVRADVGGDDAGNDAAADAADDSDAARYQTIQLLKQQDVRASGESFDGAGPGPGADEQLTPEHKMSAFAARVDSLELADEDEHPETSEI